MDDYGRQSYGQQLVDAVNAHADQLVDAEVMDSARLHVGDVFRCDVMDSHCDQFVGIGMRITHALQFLNELR